MIVYQNLSADGVNIYKKINKINGIFKKPRIGLCQCHTRAQIQTTDLLIALRTTCPNPLDDSASWLGNSQDIRCTPVRPTILGDSHVDLILTYLTAVRRNHPEIHPKRGLLNSIFLGIIQLKI